MKKKNLLTLMLVGVLAFALGMGTLAYFTKTFTSNDNLVRAARFEVDSNGTLDGDVKFNLNDDPLYPGMSMDVYEFEIDQKGTEVPVEYAISVSGFDPLFEGKTPVDLTVLRKVEDEWVTFEDTVLANPESVEYFKINLNWSHSDNDTDYQGKLGKININVVASQVDEELPPVDPEEPEDPAPTFDASYFKWGVTKYALITEVEGLEGATHYDTLFEGITGGRKLIGKAVAMGSGVPDELESIYVRVYSYDETKRVGERYTKIWEGEVHNPTNLGTRNPDPYL